LVKEGIWKNDAFINDSKWTFVNFLEFF
jgi:hypothetical protein